MMHTQTTNQAAFMNEQHECMMKTNNVNQSVINQFTPSTCLPSLLVYNI